MTEEIRTSTGKATHFGLGWIKGIPPFDEEHSSAVWHGVIQQGSTTALLLLPTEEIGVIILSNLGELGEKITRTLTLIISVLSQ